MERVQKILEEFVESHIEKMGEEKFGCKLCTKLFRSAEFVERHIHNKHKSVLEEIEEKANEDVYAQNYVEEKLREDRKSRPYGGGFGRPGFSGPLGGRGYDDAQPRCHAAPPPGLQRPRCSEGDSDDPGLRRPLRREDCHSLAREGSLPARTEQKEAKKKRTYPFFFTPGKSG